MKILLEDACAAAEEDVVQSAVVALEEGFRFKRSIERGQRRLDTEPRVRLCVLLLFSNTGNHAPGAADNSRVQPPFAVYGS